MSVKRPFALAPGTSLNDQRKLAALFIFSIHSHARDGRRLAAAPVE